MGGGFRGSGEVRRGESKRETIVMDLRKSAVFNNAIDTRGIGQTRWRANFRRLMRDALFLSIEIRGRGVVL